MIPARCRDLHLKQFCLEDIAPAVLIILIAHIVLAVRWMLIKSLSAAINHYGTVNTVVSGGCHLIILFAKLIEKSRYCGDFPCQDLRRIWSETPAGTVGASIAKSAIQFDKLEVIVDNSL